MNPSYTFKFTRPLSIVILFLLSSFQLDAQCEPVCRENTDIYLCYESTVEVLPKDVLKPIHPDCLKDMVVEVFQNGNSIGNQVSYLLAGQTLDVTLTDTTNLFTCQSTITIERDSTPPTAVCDEHTVTTLPSSGSAVLCADNFDSGSYDNCFLQSIKIRRMDGGPSFKNCIRVSCSDVGDPIMIVLQATDYEGLTDICMVELTVQEKVAPQIDCPDDIDISCKFDPSDVNITGRATATDNCNIKEITHTDNDLRDDCGVGVIERTWTATDYTGNISTCVQIIRTLWEREPIVFFPADKIANCTQAYDLEFTGKPRIYDYCSRLAVNKEDRIFRQDECSFKILRDWSVLDWCSLKEYKHTQIIKVFDIVAPVFVTPPGALDITYQCTEDIVLINPEAVDDCNDITIKIDSDEIIPGDCPNKFTRIITYLAMDPCMNTSEPYVVTITIDDTIAPTANPLANLGPFPCYENIPDANPDDVIGEADNCSGPVIVDFVGDSPDPGCMGIVIRTYRLTDECGNSREITQSIEIKDDINPTANPLPELGPFTCNDSIPVPDVNIVIASDNCGNPVMVVHIGDSPDPGCSGNITRAYRIEDSCGNAVDIFQNIIINDDVAPTAAALPDLGPFDCYEERIEANPSIVNTADNCGLEVSVIFVSDSPDPGCMGTVIRTYQLEDVCGNIATITQNLLIEDRTAPTADALPNIGPFTCMNLITQADPNIVTGKIDNCGGIVSVRFGSDSAPIACQGFVQRTYIIADECGNENTVIQNIEINDDVNPTANPLDGIGPFACLADAPAPNPNIITGEADNCGTPTVSFIGETGDTGCSGVVTRTYRVSDECGNFIDIPQHITILDETAPTADPLPDMGVFVCATDIPQPDPSIVTGEDDNCGDEVTVTFLEDSDAPLCEGIVTRTYRLTDVCGNFTDVTQNFSIKDTIAPTATATELGPFACYDDVPDPDNQTVFGVMDNCTGTVRVTHIGPDSGDPGCSGIVERLWRLRDECGNETFLTQNIIINDDVAPTADTLPNIGPFTCLSDVPDPDINIVTGENDNCGGIVMVTIGNDSAPISCEGFMIRTYIITDECGNTANVIQNIEINDDVMPTADPLEGIGPFACLAGAPDPNPNIITGVSDNCSMPTVVFIGETGTPECSGVITRTYRITDECGNFIDITQHITILDEIPPVADTLPDMGGFSCIENIPKPDPSIITGTADNCDGEITVAFLQDSNAPICEGVVIRTYRVSDECGNFVDVTQSFSFQDTIAPTATAIELGPFACYDDIPDPDNQTIFDAVDNCTNHTIRVTHIGPDAGDPGCSGIVERLWRLRDECGNTSFLIQNIIINDDVAPTADSLPDMNFTCLNEIPQPDIDVVENEADNCADRVFISFDKDIIISTCPDTIKRSYFVEDECGNVLTLFQNIIINDNLPPSADPLPSLGIFACYAELPEPNINLVNATDNCIEDFDIVFIGDSPDPGCTGTVIRTYSVTDRCGNSAEITQFATINDNVPPELATPPNFTIFSSPTAVNECDEFVNILASAIDNCELPVTITNNSPVGPGTADASGEYPLGLITSVLFTAEDACENTISKTVTVEVIDTIAPILSCQNGQATIGSDLIATITPDDIIFGGIAFDFCTPVTFELSQDTFTCADLGPNVVTLTITDTFGNSSSCPSQIDIVDPSNICGSPTPRNEVVISGKIVTPFYRDVAGVEVNISGISKTGMTNNNGTFLIQDVPMHNNYMVKPKKVDDYLNGVSTFDLVLLNQHILGTKPFDSPYQYIAGDVNNSGTISGSDVIQIRKLILNKIDAFANNDSWRFIRYDYNFLNPLNPLGEDLPEEKMISNLSQSEYRNDFVAIKIGDINNDVKVNNFLNGKDGNQKYRVALGVEDQIFESGKEYEVAFRAKDLSRTLGYQFTLNFNEKVLEFVDLIPGNIEDLSLDNFGLDYVYDGLVSTSFANVTNTNIDQDEILFSIIFKVNAESRLSSLVKISSDLTTAEAYQSNAKTIDLLPIEIAFENVKVAKTIEADFRLYQNRPNPFNNETIIGFDLPNNASIVFSVFDISGRRIHTIKDSYSKGYNEIKLQDYQLNTSGIFYYRIDTPFGSITKKMTMLRNY